MDPETRFTFADEGNVCYARPHPKDIELAHQTHYCLTDAYLTCPIYQLRQKSIAAVPGRTQTVLIPRWAAVLTIVALLLIFGGIAFFVRLNLQQVSNANGEGTALPTTLPAVKVTSMATIYIFGQASATPLPTVTMPVNVQPSATPFLPEPTATPITPSPTPLPPTFTPTASATPPPSATFPPIFVPSATRPPQLPSATTPPIADTPTSIPSTATQPPPATNTQPPPATETPQPQPTATSNRPTVPPPTPTSDRPTVQP